MLAGADPEGDERGDRGLKVGKLIPGQKCKMGWYKVPCSSFDYAPASLDPILLDRGVKEPDDRKINTATLVIEIIIKICRHWLRGIGPTEWSPSRRSTTGMEDFYIYMSLTSIIFLLSAYNLLYYSL